MSWDSKLLALLIRNKIVENTQKEGKDKDGIPFKPLSTRPFSMPHGAITNKAKKKKNPNEIRYFRKRKNDPSSLWVTWLNGYKRYKEIMYGNSMSNLTATGKMLDTFSVLRVVEKGDSGGTTTLKTDFGEFQIPIPKEVCIKLGWNSKNKEQGKIAEYHKKNGRDMLGLPQKQIENIVNDMLKNI